MSVCVADYTNFSMLKHAVISGNNVDVCHVRDMVSGEPKKMWNEVLVDDRKKLGKESADPQNRSEWRETNPRKRKTGFKMNMMMMMAVSTF